MGAGTILHALYPLVWGQHVNLADTVVLQHRRKTTPTPFARRNVFCGNRLYQNKYEMNERVQEARIKGMSNPRDIWRYARQKETALHGA